MDLRQLEYLVHVAEEANFTRAAAKAHVAQPAISAQIRRLERELGEPLFDRTKRTVRLTDAGAALLPHARAALRAVADGRAAVDDIRGLVRGSVTIGIMAALPSIDIAGMLAVFHRDHPAVMISLSEASSDLLLDRLDSGQIDAAVIGLPGPPPDGVEVQIVCDEQLVVATSHQDPLAARSRITLDVLRDRPLISLPRGSGLRSFLQAACARAGFDPDIALEAGDLQLLVQLTAKGLGASVLPRSIANAYPQLHILAVSRPRLPGRIALAWRTAGPHSPAARQFIHHARTTLTPLRT